MNLKVTVPVVTEPVTLLEAKKHLRLDTTSFSTGVISTQSIKPGLQSIVANFGLIGTSVDVLGYTAMAVLQAGTNGTNGTVNVKLQESNGNITFTDVSSGAFSQVTTANDETTYNLAYTGKMRYIRAVATVAAATCNFSVSIVKDANTSQEDTLIESLITVAREKCENITNRALATQTIVLSLDQFPSGNIRLPRPPLVSVTSIKYKDSAGTDTTWDSSNYIVDIAKEPGEVALAYGISYPLYTEYASSSVKITYVAGYITDCPKAIKQAMLLLIGHYYENREEFVIGQTIAKIPRSVDDLLSSYRIWT